MWFLRSAPRARSAGHRVAQARPGVEAARVTLRVIPAERVPLVQKPLLVAEILLTYATMRWRMRRGDVRKVVESTRAGAVSRRQVLSHGSPEAWLVARRLGNAVEKTLRMLPADSRCLIRSLVLARLLSVRSIPNTVVIGAHTDQSFAAHAWVEQGGRPVLPPQGFFESRLLEL